MVTHDRYFLDQVTNRITELDHASLYSYETNYSGYLQKKAEREQNEDSAAAKRKNLLRTELEWLNRGARARSTKQKAHIQRIENLQEQRGPVRDRTVQLDSVASRLGKTTLEVEGLAGGYPGHECFSKRRQNWNCRTEWLRKNYTYEDFSRNNYAA